MKSGSKDALRARKMRESLGLSLNEIVERLQRPKTTVYSWIKDCKLTKQQQAGLDLRKKNALKNGTHVMVRKRAKERKASYDAALLEAASMLSNQSFRDFIVLYMAEGSRTHKNLVGFTNTDSELILLAYRWIRKLSTNKVRVWIHCREYEDRKSLTRFWTKHLGVGKDVLGFVTKQGPVNAKRSPYGVAKVGVSDTHLKSRLDAYMDYVRRQWAASSIG